jgi:hypothetical protein
MHWHENERTLACRNKRSEQVLGRSAKNRESGIWLKICKIIVIPAIKPYRTYLYRNKVLVITKVTTQDTPKPVSKELCHRLYRNLKLPTNTIRQSTATSQFNRSPRVAPNTFKQLVIVQKHTLTPTRIIKPPTSSVREVLPRRLP